MHRRSSSLRMDIISSVFALVVSLLIGMGVYLMFRWGGMGAQAERGLIDKGLPLVGLLTLKEAYHLRKKYKAEQGGA